ncbi:hypothetical protein [Streptomyces sp. OE57]|uniref:hypothetical protein n=1 Tax=Streptomyces lacaronensis TaxID=3379885 RepID=UPI0039B74A9F
MNGVTRSVDDHGPHTFASQMTGQESVAAPDVDDRPGTLGSKPTGDYGMDVTSCRKTLRGRLLILNS